MTTLAATAAQLVGVGKGILAADESIGTMNSRLEGVGVACSAAHRGAYRALLLTTPGLSDGVSGIIYCDETLRQSLPDGRTFPTATLQCGLIPGIKVDTGAKALAGADGETVTEGLDGLRERLAEYAALGARFAKWRAVIRIDESTPSHRAIRANAHALARYAALCQEAGIVPIVEPEVLMDGVHTLGRCAIVTSVVLLEVFGELHDAGMELDGIVLKPNMVLPGKDCMDAASTDTIATTTVHTLRTVVPAEVAGIAFLSGGQGEVLATERLAAMQSLDAPWPMTFSFGRALVDPALAAWHGDPARVPDGHAALAQRVRCNSAALSGVYSPMLERESVSR
ncbi:MAG: class I fructose-bisphosphate aldolase [Geodermatophilaceae bacterium]